MAISRMLSRPMLASTFAVSGAKSLRDPHTAVPQARVVTDRVVPALQTVSPVELPKDPAFWVRLNGATQVAAAGALAFGIFPRLAAGVLATSLVPTTLAAHRFWEAADPTERAQQRAHFFKNVSLLGGLLTAAGDTEGRPGLAWRTRHAASDARGTAGRVTRQARREARRTVRDAGREARHASHNARREAHHLAGAARTRGRLAKAEVS
jgi:putative oxidoreductase